MTYFNPEDLKTRLKTWDLGNSQSYRASAFSRNIGILTRSDMDRLATARVAIAGMGGVGGSHAVTLARCGVGGFHLADFDRFEPANINRQQGARVTAFGRPKAEVVREDVLLINPFADVKLFVEGVTESNIDGFLDGVDVVLDGLDFFAIKARRLLFRRARERAIPVVTAGPIGFGTPFMVFTPDGMSFDEYFDLTDRTSTVDSYIRFYLGMAPQRASPSIHGSGSNPPGSQIRPLAVVGVPNGFGRGRHGNDPPSSGPSGIKTSPMELCF
jgi:molybdopterin/thiamine biosynthesis adenylyltransferase